MRATSGFVLVLLILPLALLAAEAPSPIPRDTLPAELPLTQVPLGLGERPEPKDNPLDAKRVALGRRLFFDPILSADGTVACATCHHPARGFAGNEAHPRGLKGQATRRRPPSLLNRAWGQAFFWDGRASSLEAQALKPIENPAEMGSSVPEALDRLRKSDYKKAFEVAFPEGVTAENLGRSLASFERVLVRGDSRVDRFRHKGEHAGLTPAERHGLWLYESKARCWRCHGGSNFSDEGFHNTGVSWSKVPQDLGRYETTRREEDRGKFKTPSLRGVVLTAPYMHDGSLATLTDVIEFYNRGGTPNPSLDPILVPLDLKPEEVKALVAFLEAL